MSNYFAPAVNPETGKVEQAEFIDNFFGSHQYGVRFPTSPKVYPVEGVDLGQLKPKGKNASFELPQLFRSTFEFTQDGNTVGSTSDTETCRIIFETQMPGEEPFFVLKTKGWSFDDLADIMTLLVSAKAAHEAVRSVDGKLEVLEKAELPTPPVFQTTKAVIVAHDNENGDQAIYIDGKFKGCDSTIYAHDITEAVGGPEIPFTLEQRNYDNCLEDPTETNLATWPDNLSDLELMNSVPELGPLDLKAEDF